MAKFIKHIFDALSLETLYKYVLNSSVSVAVGRPVNTVLGASTHASMVEAVDVGVSRCTAEHGVASATSTMSYIMLRWRSGGGPSS